MDQLFTPPNALKSWLKGCLGSAKTSEVPSHFGSLRKLSTRRTHGTNKPFTVLKGVGGSEGFHLLHQSYLLNRFQLAHKQSRCGAQMRWMTMTAKTGRKEPKRTENGSKTAHLRVKSACLECFFASKRSLFAGESAS